MISATAATSHTPNQSARRRATSRSGVRSMVSSHPSKISGSTTLVSLVAIAARNASGANSQANVRRPLRAPAFASASYAEEFNAGEQHTGHREWVATVKCPYCEAEFCPPTLDGLETVICSNCQCECNKRGVLVCVDCWNTAEAARAREEIRQQELEQAQQQRKANRDRLYAMGNTGHMG